MLAASRFFRQAISEGLTTIHAPEPGPTPPTLDFVGRRALASAFPVTDLAAASIGAAAQALASYLATHNGDAPDVIVDRRRASLWFGYSLRPLGWRLPDVRDPITGDYQGRDGWIRLHANAPHHRQRALAVLHTDPDRTAVARAIARHSVWTLEETLVAAGACAAAMRTDDQWAVHPQGLALAEAPLLVVTPGSANRNAARRPLNPVRPLAGLRVLDLTRVLAGPVATRFLAGYGARVLRIDPPTWTEPGLVPEVTPGKYCAGLDLTIPAHRTLFTRLLAEADVLVHGYRPDALANLGFGDQERQAIRPGLIDVSLDAYGWSGPWAKRRGFDSLVQMSCGIADAGMRWQSADHPVPLPVQALDQASGYLMAAAVLHGLIRRDRTGTGCVIRLALARTARLLMSAPRHRAPELAPLGDADFSTRKEMTAWGPAQRLAPPCRVGSVPLYWTRPAGDLRTESAKTFTWNVATK